MHKALFLDRDGVVNVDYGYVHKKENFHFIDGIFDLVKAANKKKFKVIIVTNQAGIARGYFSEKQFLEITNWMKECFQKNDCFIDKVYYCPFHPTEGIGPYLRDAFCRKPNPGMLFSARKEVGVDFSKSILVGDSKSDMIAAERAGINKLFFYNKKASQKKYESVQSLHQILDFINDF